MDEKQRSLEGAIMEHLNKALHAPVLPDLSAELEAIPEMRALHDYITELRNVLGALSRGDVSMSVRQRGIVAGRLKALQASLLHLTWQIQQVANGDYTQRVDFLGEFSQAFNSMVERLNATVNALHKKEEELTRLTQTLQSEVEQKAEILAALRKSEASFRHMAEHDALTGALNRRSFYDIAVMELSRSQKAGRHCSVAIFDIDKFKLFNDTYGHIEGDGALRHVTSIVKAALRQNDTMARLGGEEFALLFPSTDARVGRSVAERLRKAVATSPVKTKFGDAPITISIGLANVPPHLSKKRDVPFLEEMLRHADEALYSAKRTGRNKLVVSPYPGKSLPEIQKS